MKTNAQDKTNIELRILENTPPWEWAENTGEILLGYLNDNNREESDRLRAVELAGDCVVINDEIADVLLAIVNNNAGSEELRGKAAISLGPALELADTDGFDDYSDVPISERAFHGIQKTLHTHFMDPNIPKYVRRRILEASVRAPQDWQREAVRTAYYNGDEDWKLTAVFCMVFVQGFDEQIVESLHSKNELIHLHAVQAAGEWDVDAAWPHIAAIVSSRKTDKPLLLAAITALINIRPEESEEILGDLMYSKDEEIVQTIMDAMTLAGDPWDEEDDEDEDEDYDEDDEDYDEDDEDEDSPFKDK